MTELTSLAKRREGVESLVLSRRFQTALAQANASLNPLTVARCYLSAVSRVPKLLDCTPASWAGAIIASTQMGLLPDGRQAAVIPFKRTATLVPMYQGLVQLAYRSGSVASIHTAVVYRDENFRFAVVAGVPLCEHDPDDDLQAEADVETARGAYAIVRIVGGESVIRWMPAKAILAVKKRSRGADYGDSPWNHPADWTWMWQKTALRAALKLAPQSYEVGRALDLDDQAATGTPQDLPVVDVGDFTHDDSEAPESPQAGSTPPYAAAATQPPNASPAASQEPTEALSPNDGDLVLGFGQADSLSTVEDMMTIRRKQGSVPPQVEAAYRRAKRELEDAR